jgi:hypothetical protein
MAAMAEQEREAISALSCAKTRSASEMSELP